MTGPAASAGSVGHAWGTAAARRLGTVLLVLAALTAPLVPARPSPRPPGTRPGSRCSCGRPGPSPCTSWPAPTVDWRRPVPHRGGARPALAHQRHDGWLAGFWPGRLWLAYQADGRPAWARRAAARQAPLAVRQDDTTAHDLGFVLQTSFGRGAALVRPQPGRRCRTSRGGGAGHPLRAVGRGDPLLGRPGRAGHRQHRQPDEPRAAVPGGRPRGTDGWRDIAVQHALTSARWQVRPDGSTFHVVRLDEQTGLPAWRGTVQGASDDSTWARGHAWAVHGFTTAYRESADERLLDAARRTAGFAVTNAPGDGVPWWDYDAPGTRRDTTAAAVLASGLLELARIDPDPELRSHWRAAGMRTLRSLVGPHYLARGTGAWSVLLQGHDSTYDESGVTYGDHYLLEALLRVELLPPSGRAARRACAAAEAAGCGPTSAACTVQRRLGPLAAAQPTRVPGADLRDGRRWTTARGGVSSGPTTALETYDLRDRATRFVRVGPLGAAGRTGRAVELLVRG